MAREGSKTASRSSRAEPPLLEPQVRTLAASLPSGLRPPSLPPSLHTRARRDMVRTVCLLNGVQGTQCQKTEHAHDQEGQHLCSLPSPTPREQRPDVALWHCEAPGFPVEPTLDPEKHSLVPLPLTRPEHPGWGHGSEGVAAPRHRGAMVSSSLTEDSPILPFSILGQKMGTRLRASQAAVVSSTWLPQVC